VGRDRRAGPCVRQPAWRSRGASVAVRPVHLQTTTRSASSARFRTS